MAQAIPYLMYAAAAVSAYAAVQQGQAAKATGKYNAAIAEQNATLAREESLKMAQQQERENYMRLGAIRAAHGKSGGEAGAGSVLDVIGDAASQGEMQRQHILYAGELKARGYNSTATLDRFQGKNAETAGYLTAGSELLSGTSKGYNSQIKRT